MRGWASRVFKDSDNAEDALSADRAGFVKQDEIRALIPRRIWMHIIHGESSAQIRGFQDLFIYLNNDPNANDLRRLICDYFVDSRPLRAHLRSDYVASQSTGNLEAVQPQFPGQSQPDFVVCI
jgi:hypothetical protein